MNKKFVVIGLGYGDEGKGTITDYLVRENNAEVVVRFNGGPQAAHHVVMPDGSMHCFSQFGSGTLVPEVKTYLSRFMLVDPLAIKAENEALKAMGIYDGLDRLIMDRDCLIVTPFHKIIGRMLEVLRGEGKHGSCGKGVGRAVEDGKILGSNALRVGDLLDARKLKEKLIFLWRIKVDLAEQLIQGQPGNDQLKDYFDKIRKSEYPELVVEAYEDFARSGAHIADDKVFENILSGKKRIIFEGAQGALLDVERGFLPYVTSTKTTAKNAYDLMNGKDQLGDFKKIGILRAYATRHGVGPFVTEDAQLTKDIPDMHNGENEWQGPFRIGWFDLLTARYAIDINGGVDEIALTSLDRLNSLETIKICTSYEYIGQKKDWLEKCFRIEKMGDERKKIVGIRTELNDRFPKEQLAGLLSDCRPWDFLEFKGWKKDLDRAECFDDLSEEAKEFLEFMETDRGLAVPVSIVSKGPTWADKIKKPPF